MMDSWAPPGRRSPKNLEQHFAATGTQMMEIPKSVTYHVQIEEGPTSFGAQVVELPGCFAVASTRQEVLARIREAVKLHLQSMIEDGEEIPMLAEVSEEEFQLA